MKKKSRKITVRTALISVLILSLLSAATVFLGANAASNDVSDSNGVSGSDAAVMQSVPKKAMLRAAAVAATALDEEDDEENNDTTPTNLGAPKIIMTTGKGVGETLAFDMGIRSAYIDWGDGNIVSIDTNNAQFSGELKGDTVKVYTDSIISIIRNFICDGQQLTSLDVSNATGLTNLMCNSNNLTELDLSNNTALNYLDCHSNNLTKLDVSKNTDLKSLWCNDNNLTTLDVSNDTALTKLSCDKNKLTELDVSNNTALTELQCINNNLSTLDVSNNTALKSLSCSENNLATLDVSNHTALTKLSCSENNLSTLDVSGCTSLKDLSCDKNKLTELDVSNNTALTELYCSINNLSTLDVSNNTALNYLMCIKNNLSTLDVSKNTALKYLVCYENNLSTLDVSNNTALKYLMCYDNNLTELDVSKNTALTTLQCYNNNLKFSTIKLPENSSLKVYAQAPVSIASSINSGETIDLSSEYDINGTNTVYTWYDSSDNEVTPTKSANGIFTFGDEFVGKSLYCQMTNEYYPDWLLTTTSVTVEKSEPTTTTTTTTTTEATTTTTVPGPDTYSITIDDESKSGFVESAQTPYDTVVKDEGGNVVALDGLKLVVGNIETNTKKTVLEAIQNYNKALDANTDNIALYDISLTDKNGVKVTVENGRIKVCLKYPDNLARQSEKYTFKLYHQKHDGSIEEIKLDCKSNGIWFYADSFSPYALTWTEAKSTGNPGTGESNTITFVALNLALLSLAAAGAAAFKKKFDFSQGKY